MTVAVEVPPPISYADALRLAAVEHDRFLAVLQKCGSEDWQRPTDCERWTVRDVAGHVTGSMRDNSSSLRGLVAWLRAQRAATRKSSTPLDESTAHHVRAFAG